MNIDHITVVVSGELEQEYRIKLSQKEAAELLNEIDLTTGIKLKPKTLLESLALQLAAKTDTLY